MQAADLIPEGRMVSVTNENVFRYIQLVANFKLNVEINAQVPGLLGRCRQPLRCSSGSTIGVCRCCLLEVADFPLP